MEFLAAHELEFYYNGETRDSENNCDWRKAMSAVAEFETAEQEKTLEDFGPHITEERYLEAVAFLASHKLEFYPNGKIRDDYYIALEIMVEFETEKQEKALGEAQENFPPPILSPPAPKPPAKKKGRSWIPRGGKLESYYYDVKNALATSNSDGLLELYYEATGKRNRYARINYMRIYNLLTLKQESARS